jgi:hypothetical protein
MSSKQHEVKVGDTVRITDERTKLAVTSVHDEGVAGVDERYQARWIRWDRVKP